MPHGGLMRAWTLEFVKKKQKTTGPLSLAGQFQLPVGKND